MLNYDDMADMAYREANPGYEREAGLTASDLADCDPEIRELVVESYARDNAHRRASNQRTREGELRQEIEELRALLAQHGITAPDTTH